MKRHRFNSLTTVGIAALAAANVFSFLLQRHTSLPESVVDPSVGFVYGIAIGATLLGLRQQAQRRECQ